MAKEIPVYLWNPHPGQRAVFKKAKRFNVMPCGRRYGKTITGEILAMDELLEPNKRIAWISISYGQLTPVYNEFLERLRPLVARPDKQAHTIYFKNGSIADFWSLDSERLADSIRGRAYHLMVLDEAAAVMELHGIWNEVLRPTLVDFRGSAWFLSTPRGYNYFHDLYQRGLSTDPSDKDWASFHAPSFDNPYLPPEEREDLLTAVANGNMTAAQFAQEYMAEFLSPEGLVLGLDYDGTPIYAANRNVKPEPCPWDECKWRIVGVDPGGSTGDPAALIAIGIDNSDRHHVYAAYRREGVTAAQDVVDWVHTIERRMGAKAHRWMVGEVAGDTFTRTLQRFGAPALVANKNRSIGIPHMQQLFRTGRLTINPGLKELLEQEIYAWAFAPKKVGRSGNDPYQTISTSEKHHADLMDALRYALLGVFDAYPDARKTYMTQVGREPGLRKLGAYGLRKLGA